MRIFRSLVTAAGLLAFSCGAALADVSVYFSPSDSYQNIGSSFEIKILADISRDPGLVAFGFNLTWDNSMMQLKDVNGASSPWDILWDGGTPHAITGFLFPTPTSPASIYGTGVVLANLDFECLRDGSSPLDIALDPDLLALGLQGFYGPDPNSTDPLAGVGPLLDFNVTPGSVDQGVAPVPEPGSIVLLGAAIVGLAVWKKRK